MSFRFFRVVVGCIFPTVEVRTVFGVPFDFRRGKTFEASRQGRAGNSLYVNPKLGKNEKKNIPGMPQRF